MKIFVCEHRRLVTLSADGHTWKHITERGSPPFYMAGQTGAKCNGSIYVREIELELGTWDEVQQATPRA